MYSMLKWSRREKGPAVEEVTKVCRSATSVNTAQMDENTS